MLRLDIIRGRFLDDNLLIPKPSVNATAQVRFSVETGELVLSNLLIPKAT
jgi:hypothetical protein